MLCQFGNLHWPKLKLKATKQQAMFYIIGLNYLLSVLGLVVVIAALELIIK